MSNLTLLLPRRLNGAGMRMVAAEFIDACAEALPKAITINFAALGFVEPSGVTFLGNLVSWLRRAGSCVRFINHQRSGDAIRFLDDSLFFEQHGGGRLTASARPRDTTQPLQSVDHERSHEWLRVSFTPWLSSRTGLNEASLHPLQVSLSELFNNIQDHSSLNVGSIFIQHFPRMNRVGISVADFGRGIPAAVQTVLPELDDAAAIKQAVQPGFTTRSTPRNSGIGLDYLLQTAVVQNGGTVSIFSLCGHVLFTRSDDGVTATPVRSRGFCPGTTIDISLRTDTIVSVEDETEDLEW